MSAEVRSIGERVAHLRGLRGFSQSQLATRSGVSRSSVASIETGHQSPSFGSVGDLAAALGVAIAALYGEEPIPHVPDVTIEIEHIVRCDDCGLVTSTSIPEEARDFRQAHIDGHLRARHGDS